MARPLDEDARGILTPAAIRGPVALERFDPSPLVDQLARAAGVRVRRVQRLFADHVGVGPKGLIRRYRLYEAAERVAWGEPAEWAALAAELGYSDQAHLTRDFTAAYGRSPERYARDCAAALAAAAEPS